MPEPGGSALAEAATAIARTTAADTESIEPLLVALEAAVEELLTDGDAATLDAARGVIANALASPGGGLIEDEAPDAFARAAALLTRLARAGQRIGPAQLLASYGGKPSDVLAVLAGAGDAGLLQGEVLTRLGIEASYLSKVVARLAEHDLIERWSEGRHRRLVATAAGRDALADVGRAPAIAPTRPRVELVPPLTRTGRRMHAAMAVSRRPAELWAAPGARVA